MEWIKRLLTKWLYAKELSSNVHFETGTQNGQTIKWALKKAKEGWKVSRIMWGQGQYLFYDTQNERFCRVCHADGNIDVGYWSNSTAKEVIAWFAKARTADYVSCDWYVVGKWVE